MSRILCKKNYSNTFIKDKSYEFVVFGDSDKVIKGINHLAYSWIDDGVRLFVLGRDESIYYLFYDYFCSVKDIRKMKLKNIVEKSYEE